MTFYGQQFLYVSNALGTPSEVINGARTARRMVSIAGLPFSNPIPNGGCDILTLEPCTTTVTGGGTTLTRTSWAAVDFAASGAPWYNSAVPASGEALGFFIEEWSGLDGAHHARAMQPVGALRGGAVPGVLGHKHRVMKLNVLLHGTTERSLNYLFRWLEQVLMDCCNNDGYRQVWVRESCPILSAPTEGLRMLNEMVLVEGPTWETQPTDSSGCYVRRASFTIAAGDPCMYSPDTDVTSGTATLSGATLSLSTTASTHGTFYGTNRQLIARLPAPQVGRMGPVVTISSPLEMHEPSGYRATIPDLRITGYMDPANVGFNQSNNHRVGELIVAGRAASGLVIEVNIPARSIRYRDPYADNQWYDGTRFLAPVASTGVPRWWSVGNCTPSLVIVEPRYVGLKSSWDDFLDVTSDPVSTWDVDVNAVEINGCC